MAVSAAGSIFAIVSILASSQIVGSAPGVPILLVPGLTGSQLDVQHDSGFSICHTFGSYVGLWVSEVRFFNYGCFSSEMTLTYDQVSDEYSSISTVKVTVPGFGNTTTVEKLNQNGLIPIPYFSDFVNYFVERGYERGKDIRAAPYDWRLAPDELERRGYFSDLKRLIETMYRENGNTKVTIVAHSMGGPVTLHFLTSGLVSQSWKDQHIGNFIPLSGAWSGGNEALQTQVSGLSVINTRSCDMFNVFHYISDQIRYSLKPILRSHQSMSFLLPRPSVWTDTVLVSTPTQTYTASDYERLFSDIGFTDGFAMFKGIADINENFPAPNVPTHCFYGVGVDTPLSFHYGETFPGGADDDPKVTMGDGDGTVNTLSSEVCLQWASNGGYRFSSMTFDEVGHQAMVSDKNVLQEVGKIVGASDYPVRKLNRNKHKDIV